MQIQFYIRGLSINPAFRHRHEVTLERLGGLVAISAAAVVLEHQREEALPFRAYVSLAVPGPDIHAEARDHTLEAAWLKAATALRRQIDQRKSRQDARVKRNGQVHARASRLPGLVAAR